MPAPPTRTLGEVLDFARRSLEFCLPLADYIFPSNGELQGIFHSLARALPNHSLPSIEAGKSVRDAFTLMQSRGVSELAVVQDGKVVTMFSYRSFALGVLGRQQRMDLAALPVEDFHDGEPPCAHADDPLESALDHFAKVPAVVVGQRASPRGLLSGLDLLRYLNATAWPFLAVSEIELTVRYLIALAVGDQETLIECLRQSHAHILRMLESFSQSPEAARLAPRVPADIEDMTFKDYSLLVTCGDNWERFKPFFGGDPRSVRTQLEQIGELRNQIFHFRRPLDETQQGNLRAHRGWASTRARIAAGRAAVGARGPT